MKKWEIVKSKVVHKNRYFSVVMEEFKLANGNLNKYYLLKSQDFVIIIAVQDGYIYLEGMDRYALRKRMIEIPMGNIEEGETPIQAAKRELKEETGIAAKTIKKLGYINTAKGRSNHKGIIFVAENLVFGEQKLDMMEKEGNMKVLKLKISEVEELIRCGKITDADTIASFYLFMLNYKGQDK